jgi:outer membrane protein assembly factor BamB
MRKDFVMTSRLTRWMLLGMVLAAGGCSSGISDWRYFHGDLSGEGFRNVRSGFAISPSWISEPLRIVSSSPVIGRNEQGLEVLYVGTVDAQLVALEAVRGKVLWKLSLDGPSEKARMTSSPALGPDGGIIIAATRELDGGWLQTTLHKVDPQGNLRWSYAFPDQGFSTGSPKVFVHDRQALVVAAAAVLDTPGGVRSELLVLRDLGQRVELLARKPLGDCPAGRGDAGDPAGLRRAWLGLTSFPAASGGFPGDGFLDPTPAVVASRSKPLIAVADHLCRIEVYEWDGRELVAVWQAAHGGQALSSPAVVFGNLLVIGNGSGVLTAYDVETGVKMWEYDAGEPVLATPAGSSKGVVFVVSETQMHAVSGANGVPVIQAGSPQRFRLPGVTRSSPAVTADCVYVATQEMVTVSHDFKARSHNMGFSGAGVSSPAVGGDGSIYAVGRNGAIWKFRGSN